MTSVSKGDHPGEASVNMPPIIDMDQTNLSCIYCTLNFITDLPKKLQKTPFVRFDQPFWLKAIEIVYSSNFSIIFLLGGFDTMMSVAGNIGTLMHGSGLEAALDCIYDKVTISHFLSGKAIATALQAHFLVESFRMTLLLKLFFLIIQIHLKYPVSLKPLVKMTNFHLMMKARLRRRLRTI